MSIFGRTRSKNCKSKKRYANSTAANAALGKINPQKSLNKPRRSYRCSECLGWHLSSKPAK